MKSFRQILENVADASKTSNFTPDMIHLHKLIASKDSSWLDFIKHIRNKHGVDYSTNVLRSARSKIKKEEIEEDLDNQINQLLEDGMGAVSMGPTNVTGPQSGTDPQSATAVNPKKKRRISFYTKRNPPKM